MKAIGYFTSEPVKKIEYKTTFIDELKAKADMLIEYCNGDSYTVNTKGIEISGRGVKTQYGNGFYEVTESKLCKLESEYNVMTNF